MADAYKLKADASFRKPLLEDEDGNAVAVVGNNYPAGSFLLASDLTKRDRERAANGDLDHLLEEASTEDAEAGQLAEAVVVVIPEHEAEAQVMFGDPTKEVVPRDQVVQLGGAGAEAAQAAQEEAKGDGADERPNLTAAEVPSLAENERGESELGIVPKESEPVDEDRLHGVEQPPGRAVGPDKAAAEGEKDTPAPAATTRSRPSARRSAAASSEDDDK